MIDRSFVKDIQKICCKLPVNVQCDFLKRHLQAFQAQFNFLRSKIASFQFLKCTVGECDKFLFNLKAKARKILKYDNIKRESFLPLVLVSLVYFPRQKTTVNNKVT